jgi:hypothetical protein
MKHLCMCQISWRLAALAVLIAALSADATRARAADTVLFQDNFSSPTSIDMNTGITSSRQSGALGFQTYTGYEVYDSTPPVWISTDSETANQNLFLGNVFTGYVYVNNSAVPAGAGTLAMTGNWSSWPWANAVVNHNFNGSDSQGGLKISFDMKDDGQYWGAIMIGADAGVMGAVFDNTGAGGTQGTRFALKMSSTTATAYESGSVAGTASFATALSNAWHHFDIVCTDPTDNNPFNGVGETIINVYLDGATTPFYTYTKTDGGYANDYIGLSTLTHDNYGQTAYTMADNGYCYFDNLTVTQVPEPGTLTLLALMGLGVAWFRLRK